MGALEFLYGTKPGRIILKPLLCSPVSRASGAVLDSKASKVFIKRFAEKNGIDVSQYETDDIESFNDFFKRKIKPGLRPMSMNVCDLVAPCDGLLTVTKITDGCVIRAKQSIFTIEELLRDKELAQGFDGGYCMVYRLCVDNYHRYSYFDSGYKHEDVKIKGFFHTVRPVALGAYPVFVQNSRNYCVIDSDSFGRCVQMEVGALMVGRIKNNRPEACRVARGEEKGCFEFGGSTIIVLIPKDTVALRKDILRCSSQDEEFPIKMGETVGRLNRH